MSSERPPSAVGPPDVFISYRRQDSPGHAGRLRDALSRQLGAEHVFFDVSGVPGGADFAVAIRRAIDRAAVVAVVVGPRWNRRSWWHRVTSGPDWVQYEIEYARRILKPLLPVLVCGAQMPRTLPTRLAFLATINGLTVRDESWDSDVARLLERLPPLAAEAVTVEAPPSTRRGVRPWTIVAALVLAGVAVWGGSHAVRGRAQPGPGTLPASSVAPPASSSKAPSAGATSNRPPTPGKIDVDQFNAVGLQSATVFKLTAVDVADPDGDAVSYRWDFGDGSPPPPSAASVSKVYDRVSGFTVRLFVTDGRSPEILAAEKQIIVRDVTGTWTLTLQRGPDAPYPMPAKYTVTLVQQGNQLSGRITPDGSARSTLLSGSVEHPLRVYFGSESPWWNDDSDTYFDLELSDRFQLVQMQNRTPGRCGPQVACQSAFMQKQ